MSQNQRPQSGGGHPEPQNVPADIGAVTDSTNHEASLVELYQELTGTDASLARSVFMYVVGEEEEFNADRKM